MTPTFQWRTFRESAWQSLTSGARIWRQAPGFSATIAILVALVVGTSASVFSVLHGLLTKPAPGVTAAADRLVLLGALRNGRMITPEDSYPNYRDYASQTHTLAALAAFGSQRLTLSLDDGTYAVAATLVSDNYFSVLGVPFYRGRGFLESDGGDALEVVVSERFWRDQLGAAPDIVARTVSLNGHGAEVVGIVSSPFRGVSFTEAADVWVRVLPYARMSGAPALVEDRSDARFLMIGRLAPGTSVAQAQGEFRTIGRRLEADYPQTNTSLFAVVQAYASTGFSPLASQGPILLVVLGAVSLLALIVVCLNAANLMLARVVAREREIAIQQSLGASRARIVGQQLAEALIISIVGAVGAAMVAIWLPQALVGFLPPNRSGVRLVPDVGADGQVLLYAAGLALAAALAATALPALRVRRVGIVPLLRINDTAAVGSASKTFRALVVTQVALAVVLLAGACLAYRSLTLADTVDLRFDKRNLMLLTVRTAGIVARADENLRLLERLRDRAAAVPDVTAVSFAAAAPGSAFPVEVRAAENGPTIRVDSNQVGDEFLNVLGVAPLQGKSTDNASSGGVRAAAVNLDLAAKLWPGASPIGRRLVLQEGKRTESVEIVGVVPNAILGTFRTEPRPGFMLLSARQNPAPPGEITFLIRYNGSSARLVPAVRAVFHDVDSRVPIVYVRTMQAQLESLTATTRFVQVLLTAFASVCLLVAVIGLYAVVAFTVRRRVREFGVRLALGATPARIVRSVTGEGVRLAVIGAVLGLGLTATVGQVFRSLLVGVTPTDVPTFGVVLVTVGVMAVIAAYLPAQRVARTDPVNALRND